MIHLEFDSQLFGFEVFRADEIPAEEDLKKCDLLYVFSYEDISAEKLSRWNGHLVDRKRTYRLVFPAHPVFSVDSTGPFQYYPNHERELSGADRDDLYALSYQSGINSRFKNDRFLHPSLYEKMYRTWMINSINGKLAYSIMLAVLGEKIVGMMTLEGKEPETTNLGLVAVSEEMQGKGVGKNLMNATFQHIFDEKKHKIVTTVTHGQDERACRYYEKMGFEIVEEIKVYHLWPRGPRA